jgi:hypothetical protein
MEKIPSQLQSLNAQMVSLFEESDSMSCAVLRYMHGSALYYGEYGLETDKERGVELVTETARMGLSVVS